MANERTPILPSSAAAQPPAAHPRRRLAFIAAALVAIVALVVVIINVSVNFSAAKAPGASAATTSSPETASSPASSSSFTPTVTFPADAHGSRDLLPYCEEKFFTQNLNQFVADGGGGTYEQRYFVCGQQFFNKENGTIFFYNGNEADVLLYLNNTGLMWENAQEYGAMLVFAEHRYFGKSVPFGDDVSKHMQYLSTEQTLADYAVLIEDIKQTYGLDVPVIGFGGSYGGMLGSWFRMKYPHILDGVIAASAPILAFVGDEKPVDTNAFARVTTFDASPEAGSAEQCVPNVRRAWQSIRTLGKSDSGRQQLLHAFSLCDGQKIETDDDVEGVVNWAKSAFDYLAMGNYPYPSPYIMNGVSVLPAYPVRVACEHLKETFADDDHVSLLSAFRDAIGVYYNSTHDAQCYQLSAPSNESQRDSDFWQYLFCSELYMPQSLSGETDMFWSVPANATADDAACMDMWGLHLRPKWAVTQYGGRKALAAASNMVLSNGNFDPWSGTGVLADVSDSVVYVPVEGGAHHVDLFFSNELDPPAVKQARATEKEHMWKWVKQYYANRPSATA